MAKAKRDRKNSGNSTKQSGKAGKRIEGYVLYFEAPVGSGRKVDLGQITLPPNMRLKKSTSWVSVAGAPARFVSVTQMVPATPRHGHQPAAGGKKSPLHEGDPTLCQLQERLIVGPDGELALVICCQDAGCSRILNMKCAMHVRNSEDEEWRHTQCPVDATKYQHYECRCEDADHVGGA